MSSFLPSHLPQLWSPLGASLAKTAPTHESPSPRAIHRALDKAAQGERLSFEDGYALYHCPNLPLLGSIAHAANLRKNKNNVYFNINRHINPTNICALSCQFCAFSRKPGQDGAYAYSPEDISKKAIEAQSAGAREVHMVGGLHPRWQLKDYVAILKAVKSVAPQLHIKAFTAVELDWLARRARMGIEDLLKTLKEAGLNSLPGGGAEIFAPWVRDHICDTKLSAQAWLDIHRTAHRLGIRSNSTMLYGHVEDVASRVHHMLQLRDLQDETGGFQVFIPLAFQPENNALGITKHTFGADDLKTIAIARLILDNFQNIKSYWVMTSPAIAQLALHYGANDIDGTVIDEKIANMAGSLSGKGLTKENLTALIQQAGAQAVERTTTYEPIGVWPSQLGPHEPPVQAQDLAALAHTDPLFTPSVSYHLGSAPAQWTPVPWEEFPTLPQGNSLSMPLCLNIPANTPTVHALRALGHLKGQCPQLPVAVAGPGLSLKVASVAPHYGANIVVLPNNTDPSLVEGLFKSSGIEPIPYSSHVGQSQPLPDLNPSLLES